MVGLSREDVLTTIAAHRDDLTRLGVATLALFGSVARGEAHSESDVDLLVELREPKTFRRYASVASYLEDLLERRGDLVIQSGLKPHVERSVREESCYVPGLAAGHGGPGNAGCSVLEA